jgi:hypothetical protein
MVRRPSRLLPCAVQRRGMPQVLLPGNRRQGDHLGTEGLPVDACVGSGWAGYCCSDSRALAGSLTGSLRTWPTGTGARHRSWWCAGGSRCASSPQLSAAWHARSLVGEWSVNNRPAASSDPGEARRRCQAGCEWAVSGVQPAVSAPGAQQAVRGPRTDLHGLDTGGVIPRECASSSSGAEDHRKEEYHDVTERQAHGSQPV